MDLIKRGVFKNTVVKDYFAIIKIECKNPSEFNSLHSKKLRDSEKQVKDKNN